MAIADVLLTDTFDGWRQKTNVMIDKVNNLGAAGDILTVISPVSGHVLVFDGTFFRNVAVSGDITIDSTGHVSVVSGGSGASKGRLYFAGWNRSGY